MGVCTTAEAGLEMIVGRCADGGWMTGLLIGEEEFIVDKVTGGING